MLEEKKVSELNDDELQRVADGYSLTANFDSGDWFLNNQTLYKVNPSNTSTTDLASEYLGNGDSALSVPGIELVY